MRPFFFSIRKDDYFWAMISKDLKPKHLNIISENTLVSHLKIEFTKIGNDYIVAKMPVDETTYQPMGILHGGASVALAETVGSCGSHFIIDNTTHYAVGIEINANHVGSAYDGFVYATGKIAHLGRTTHIWNIEIKDESEKLITIARLTMMILKRS